MCKTTETAITSNKKFNNIHKVLSSSNEFPPAPKEPHLDLSSSSLLVPSSLSSSSLTSSQQIKSSVLELPPLLATPIISLSSLRRPKRTTSSSPPTSPSLPLSPRLSISLPSSSPSSSSSLPSSPPSLSLSPTTYPLASPLSSPSPLASSLSKTSTIHKTGIKWKIIISSIIILLWQISHVLAIRKGRLMSPSSFTALSGDLHVQIQFSADEVDFGTKLTRTPTTSAPVTTARATTATQRTRKMSGGEEVESEPKTTTTNGNKIDRTIVTTLVISKYIDDLPTTTTSSASSASSTTEPTADSATVIFDNNSYEQILQRKRKEIVDNIPLYPDPRNNVTQIAIPCQTFVEGGLYEMQVVTNIKTTMPETIADVKHNPNDDNNNNSSSSIVVKNSNNINKNTKRVKSNRNVPVPTVTTTTLMPISDERLRQTLDVRWPAAEIHVSPVQLKTYPETSVEVELRFPDVNCDRAWLSHNLPEFWLELIYCGKERHCSEQPPQNVTKSAILYAEQIRGYPKRKSLSLGCELFGLAGNYAVQLRPMLASAWQVPVTRRFLSVDWSDKFVFNVYARSIFPCDPHTGIGVLFEYPACILEQGDRVRVYAKLRADVASLKPPTSLHYIAEQRVVKNQYSLYFSCDLFTEKYVEYCFVYVSQAISGAVADVRMDCLPTLPVSESDTGGWGPWSEWTPCSTNCLGGTRNRYRFCDSPPPRYGAKFCDGPSVETEKCGEIIGDTWDCIYESSGTVANVNRTEINQEIGPGCRCGCIVHLGSSKPKRLIAGATQSCPGRSFWLLQVDGQETVKLTLNFVRLPCASQYIKVRDGASLSSTLLIELKGGNNMVLPVELESTGAQLLVEFYADDDDVDAATAGARNINNNNHKNIAKVSYNSMMSMVATQTTIAPTTTTASLQPSLLSSPLPSPAHTVGSVIDTSNLGCMGGFLAHVHQIAPKNGTAASLSAITRTASVKSRVVVQKAQHFRSGFTLVHLSAVVFASIIVIISALLGAQYVLRYRKYHLAIARRRDEGSRLHTPLTSTGSLHQPPSRAVSTTTLISEVIYLVKMRPRHQLRHSILRESCDAEALARETEFGSTENEARARITLGDGVSCSSGSIATLRNTPAHSLSGIGNIQDNASEFPTATHSGDSCPRKEKDSAKDSDSFISSGMSSLCNSPPTHSKRASKYSERYDAATLKLCGDDTLTLHEFESPRSSCMREYERHSGQAAAKGKTERSASISIINGCYSPAASIISNATVRTTASTNPKESKEKQNRKKLLARPGSEFSLGNQEDLELDYYDYNVDNAGATPGSYLGMDPAYLIWIPPFDNVTDNIAEEEDEEEKGDAEADRNESDVAETEPLYEEIRVPRYGHYLGPSSNTGTVSSASTCDEFSPLSSKQQSIASTPSGDAYNNSNNIKNSLVQKVMGRSQGSCGGGAGSSSLSMRPPTPRLSRRERRAAKKHSHSTLSLRTSIDGDEALPMQELNNTKSARSIGTAWTATTPSPADDNLSTCESYAEKETAVVKSPSDLQDFLAVDDIQFADESEGSDHDAAHEMELKLLTRTSTTSPPFAQQKRLTVKRNSAASILREVEV